MTYHTVCWSNVNKSTAVFRGWKRERMVKKCSQRAPDLRLKVIGSSPERAPVVQQNILQTSLLTARQSRRAACFYIIIVLLTPLSNT